jgi:transposase
MPQYNNLRKTWRYSTDFKVKAVELSCQERVQVQ